MNELQILNIEGVECYEQDGVAYLKLENVARGLGFTRIAESGNEVVRWERVRNYLGEIGFVPTSGHDENPQEITKNTYIPENVFYRLAMKAKNEVGEKFQAKVADEIIPSIRKHGIYATETTIDNILANPDFGIKLLTQLKEERQKRQQLEEKVEADKPKTIFADAVTTSKKSILIGDLAKILKQNGINTGQNRLFEQLRNEGYLISRRGESFNTPTQKSMDLKIMELKENVIVMPDGSTRINKTTKITGKGQIYFVNKFLNKQEG
jgi:anti-repressor protein